MTSLVQWLAAGGGVLLLGTTVLLGVGLVAVRCAAAPARRQRLGELALLVAVGWLLLCWVPLPRPKLLGDVVTVAATDSDASDRKATRAAPSETAGVEVSDLPEFTETAAVPIREQEIRGAAPSLSTPPRSAIAVATRAESDAPAAWRATLARLYLAGTVICLAWLAIGWVRLRVVQWTAVEPEPWLESLFRSLRPADGKNTARLFVSRRCRGPVVYGLWRPRILLPAALCRVQRSGQLQCVLLHELVHVDRGDAWGHAMFNVALPLLYFHPLYWLLRREVGFARELIADDRAARATSKETYVEQLLDLARNGRALVAGSLGVLGAFRFRTPFSRRMKMLMDREKPLAARLSRPWRLGAVAAGAMILTAAVLLLGLPRATAQPEGEAPTTAEDPLDLPPPQPALEPPAAPAPAAPEPAPERKRGGAPTAPPETAAGQVGKSPGGLVIGDAILRAIDDIQVPAQTGGLLVELPVHDGARVEKGQLLARIDDRNARRALDAAKAKLAATRTQEVAVKAARLEAEQAKGDYERIRELAEDAAVSQSEFASAKAKLERAQLHVEQTEEELTAARRLAEIELAAAEDQVARCQITAPFGGTIVETTHKQGEWVKPGDTICRLMGLERLAVETYIRAEQFSVTPHQLAGREVTVRVHTLERPKRANFREIKGKVSYVAPQVVGKERLRIVAVIPNLKSDGSYLLLPGMSAAILIKTD